MTPVHAAKALMAPDKYYDAIEQKTGVTEDEYVLLAALYFSLLPKSMVELMRDIGKKTKSHNWITKHNGFIDSLIEKGLVTEFGSSPRRLQITPAGRKVFSDIISIIQQLYTT